MKRYLLIICLLNILDNLNGQTGVENLTGQISFISPKSVYVKFKSTAGIAAGDTLFAVSDGSLIPELIVDNLSSLSCVCTVIPPAKPAVADFVTARVKTVREEAGQSLPVADPKEIAVQEKQAVPFTGNPKTDMLKQRIKGSVSVNSYSDFSDTPADYSQRFRYTLSLDVQNITDSRFSFESYVSFRHKPGEWDAVKNDLFNALKIYNLALIYEPVKSTKISIGRKINPMISNIGAADGLQIEKSFGKFSVGALAGSRPDYSDYGFNTSLFQFGGFLGLNSKNANSFSESSVAFMQQMNGSNIDRRFLYFQHSNSLAKNLYFIGTFEVDLYRLKIDTANKTETATNGFDPTGLYLSLRYRFSSKLSISGSYDARKNVMYYESYKTFMDRMVENVMRQGFRMQASYRFARFLTLGLQTGYRFLKSDLRPSGNIYGYLTCSNIPGINSAFTISGTYTESSYMNGQIFGTEISHDFFKNKMQTSIGYNYVNYTMPENNLEDIQHIGEINLYWMLPAKMAFGINYEGTFEQQYKYHRIYLQLKKRF